MKTVFKVGQEVFDQLNFPNKKGVIVEISNDENDPYPIEVSFENKAGRYHYTPEGRFRKEHIPTLSTNPYKIELQGFEQKAPTPTYEEAEQWMKKESEKGNIFLMSKDVLEALRRLVILRDYYNDGWKPDFNSKSELKFCIITHCDRIDKDTTFSIRRVMTFKTEEIRDKFLEEQRELLEIAKPLL